jgi:hypothetical protein
MRNGLGVFFVNQLYINSLQMITENNPKLPNNFECKKCAFITSNKKDYSRHLLTAKHKKFTEFTEKTPKTPSEFICEICNKQYKSRMGLWKHQKKCTLKQESVEETPIEEPIEETPIKTSQDPPIMPDMSVFIDLLKQNQEFKELMVEQFKENQELQKQLIEATKAGGQHIENQTNINNNNNQRFNLNFFLNEQCKDAINMSDFLENMELNLEDLSETGRLGYVGGISRILVNKLQELDVYKRPMHCTDMKRETLYIKENDEWEKQVNSKEKIKTIINKVANENRKNLPQWRDEHPESQVFDTPENLEYMNLCNVSLGGFGEVENRQHRDKIMRSVVKEIMINK